MYGKYKKKCTVHKDKKREERNGEWGREEVREKDPPNIGD